MWKRIGLTALSTAIFALLLASFSFVPASQREADTYYFGFFEVFLFAVLYAGPVYFLAGIPISFLIDKKMKMLGGTSNWKRYVLHLAFYSIAGALAGIIFLVLLSLNSQPHAEELAGFALFGAAASNIYFHLSLAAEAVMQKSLR